MWQSIYMFFKLSTVKEKAKISGQKYTHPEENVNIQVQEGIWIEKKVIGVYFYILQKQSIYIIETYIYILIISPQAGR